MYVGHSRHLSLPNWTKWVIGGVAFAGTVALTALTGGVLALDQSVLRVIKVAGAPGGIYNIDGLIRLFWYI